MNEFEENMEAYGVGNAVPDLRTVPEKLTAALKLLSFEQSETRRLKAENERLKKEREAAMKTADFWLAKVRSLDSANAALTARLETAEKTDGWLDTAPAEIKQAFCSIRVLNFFREQAGYSFQMAGKYDGAMDESCKTSYMQDSDTCRKVFEKIKQWNSEPEA